MSAIDELRSWVRAEYGRRTMAVELDQISQRDIVWLNPEYRVQLSEVAAKAEELGLRLGPVELSHAIRGAIKAKR